MGVLRVLTSEDRAVPEAHGRVIEAHLPRVRTVSVALPIPQMGSLRRQPSQRGSRTSSISPRRWRSRSMSFSSAVPWILWWIGSIRCFRFRTWAQDTAPHRWQKQLGRGWGRSASKAVWHKTLDDAHLASERVEGAETTNFLTTPAGREAIPDAVARLATAGCDVVAPSCTGLTTAGIHPELDAICPMTIVDPVLGDGRIHSSLT